jgi:Spy/CpxP family protein refolding chaperone
MTTLRTLVLFGAILGLAAPASAQEQPAATQEDPLFQTLFPPELIMQHRRAIGLNDEQRDAISRLISDLQGRVLSLQWELMEEVEELAVVTSPSRVDLDRAADQLNAVLNTERQVKQAHLEMLVRIKNLLTPTQQEALASLRSGGEG